MGDMSGGAGRVHTVGELISVLSRLPKETRVLVDGYESGFDDAEVAVFQVRRLPDAKWWHGSWTGSPGGEIAVVLRRVRRSD